MHVTGLECVSCGETYAADAPRYRCDACGASVDIVYDYDEIQDAVSWKRLRERPFRHMRYREFLPVLNPRNRVRLGAGGTPLLEAKQVGSELGLDNLYFKVESQNPSGSFKDRGTSVELGKAQDFGAERVVVASTGNMGASIAAYTARAGMPVTIYVPSGLTGPKLKQMRSHGADIVTVDGDYTVAAEKAWEARNEEGTYLMGDYPYRGEGQKTVGFEIADQTAADAVVAPVGNGTLIHAVWKAFRELETVGMMDATPRLVGVQAAGCNTVVDALQKGFEKPEPVDRPDTVAGAIACGDPLDGDQALTALQESDGVGVAVDDEAIMDAKQMLAEEEGLYAEEAGAAAFAGLREEVDRFDSDETVVCLVTGHGLKT